MTTIRATFALLAAGTLLLAACGGTDSTASGGDTQKPDGACKPEQIKLIGQVRNQTNPYEAAWLQGGDEFAKKVNLTQQRLTYDGESAKQQEQIRQVLASGDARCTVLNVLPNGDSDTTPIVKQAQAAGAYLVTQWNKPADLKPADYDRWIAHITYDGKDSGKQIAEALIKAIGGSGGIVALQGILDTAAAKDRFAGLQAALAEHPEVSLLDQQTADFDRAKALTLTKTLLTKHGDAIKGVWAANDDMALGALQALEAAGKSGKVAVVGIDAVPDAVKAVQDGTMTATISSDGPWQGGIGLAMGYCAATGQLNVASVQPRAFYAKQFLVTKDNAPQFATPKVDPAEFECANLFSRVTGPVADG
ncbi:ribose transport system substrate-binding protein [Thermocatellispora tengchongensis]|uniref:Ribose transport system substrate-binding protein n=1 Tax=Thermocatellispora tengchongensis TaxID=1073253 RepID=A0A840PEQ2_9ACTN|nr:sugar ABC transporter substrate-binding protein [Thermocatellispora tengchongensis]MBB5137459.1 ribose transport system substrate-binding protein [Thermocatellispora tengchongensis]